MRGSGAILAAGAVLLIAGIIAARQTFSAAACAPTRQPAEPHGPESAAPAVAQLLRPLRPPEPTRARPL